MIVAYTGNIKGFRDYLRRMKKEITKDSSSLRGGEDIGNNIHHR